MKKNLLTLSLVVASITTYAQTAQNTYIGTKAVVKVQPNTLFYNGGDLKLVNNAVTDDVIVKNSGNIQVEGNYKNEYKNVNNSASNGSHFVNEYTDNKNYGQIIISENSTNNGKLTMEKKSVRSVNNTSGSGSSVQQMPMTFPFTDNVTNLMTAYGQGAPAFRGNCAKDTRCGQRYWMTLFEWNNDKIVNDAVPSSQKFKPGAYYLLNLVSNTGLHTYYDGSRKIEYKGTPNSEEITTATFKTVIPHYSEGEFVIKTFGDWKNRINPYNERYSSYLSNPTIESQASNQGLNNSKNFAKNVIRYGNPYTSNYNLFDVTNWLEMNNSRDLNDIEPFELQKLTSEYKHTWSGQSGSSHNSHTSSTEYVLANFIGGEWIGNKEAVILRPFEMFQLTLIENVNGDDIGIVPIKLTFKHDSKTFSKEISGDDLGNNNPSISPRNSTVNTFHQLEISLLDNSDQLITEPVYLATSQNLVTGDNLKNSSGSMLLLEENIDGNVIANAKTKINSFNSEDYIAKPLHLELKNLTVGNDYKFRFNLKENNIFTNDINSFSDGNRFYIHDAVADTFTELNGDSVINFRAGSDVLNQFTFYWKETPRTLATDDLTKKFQTKVYKFNNDSYKVRLDSSKKSADIEIYTISGIKVGSQTNINISSSDSLLNIPINQNGLFIIKVIYNDGSKENLKLLVD